MKKIIKSRLIFLVFAVVLLTKSEFFLQHETRFISRDFKVYICTLNKSSDIYLPIRNNYLKGDFKGSIIPDYRVVLPVVRNTVLMLLFIPIIILFDMRRRITSLLTIHFEGSKYKDSTSFS